MNRAEIFLAENSSIFRTSRYLLRYTGDEVAVECGGQAVQHWKFQQSPEWSALQWSCGDADMVAAALAALEAVFSIGGYLRQIRMNGPATLLQRLADMGAGVFAYDVFTVSHDLFWQKQQLWMRHPASSNLPLQFTFSGDRRHPVRPARPRGLLYERSIPWLNQTFSIRAVDIERDLPLINRWMNNPRVEFFWQEGGDIDHHRVYLNTLLDDPRVLPAIGCFDNQPFAYFEIYWAKEDRIAPFFDVEDFDRGWHLLVGEDDFRGKRWFTAWFPSLQHYLFIDDCRTRRIVAEPRTDNHRLIENSLRCGFSHIKDFSFPHKRAALITLLRERFFAENRILPEPGSFPEFSVNASTRGH